MIGYSHPVDPRLDEALEGRLSLCPVLQAALDGRNCCAACSKSELLGERSNPALAGRGCACNLCGTACLSAQRTAEDIV